MPPPGGGSGLREVLPTWPWRLSDLVRYRGSGVKSGELGGRGRQQRLGLGGKQLGWL
jgi:hypothetical protein